MSLMGGVPARRSAVITPSNRLADPALAEKYYTFVQVEYRICYICVACGGPVARKLLPDLPLGLCLFLLHPRRRRVSRRLTVVRVGRPGLRRLL